MARKKKFPEVKYYVPRNPKKFVGNEKIVLRSSWERQFAYFLDTSPDVLKWGSETVAIPYIGIDRCMA